MNEYSLPTEKNNFGMAATYLRRQRDAWSRLVEDD